MHITPEEKFRLPPNRDGQTWLAYARGFATEAVPLADEFVRRGMAPDFIDDLKARIFAVDKSSDDRVDETNDRNTPTAGIGEAARVGLEAVRELNVIVHNVYRDNPMELAAWESASHVERAPRRAEEAEEEEPPPPAPAGPASGSH